MIEERVQGNQRSPCLVLGLGNILLSDEGVGVHVVNAIRADYNLPQDVELVDGGTLGMGLFTILEDRAQVVVVDAIRGPFEPGSLVTFDCLDFLTQSPFRLSPHQSGLLDVLASLRIVERGPDSLTVIGIKPESLELGLELSSILLHQLPRYCDAVMEALKNFGYVLELRKFIKKI